MREATWIEVALLPLTLSRRLLSMAVTATAKRTARLSNDELKEGVRSGSSYCALALAARLRAISVEELVAEVGAPHDPEVFNALADGFSVYDDARGRGML